MSIENELFEAFIKLLDRNPETMVCEIVSVNKELMTCVVKDDEGLEYEDVRFTSVVVPGQKNVVAFPSVSSDVLVSMIEGDEQNLFVSAIGNLESWNLKTGEVEIDIDAQGIKISNGIESLKGLLNELIDEVSKINPTTPANIPILMLIKQRLNTVLK